MFNCPDTLDRLTRQEWNSAYFLGMEALFTENKGASFAQNIAIGARKMSEAGYCFKSLHFANKAKSTLISCDFAPAEHSLACREIAEGSFDAIARASEALDWISKECPEINTSWIEGLLSIYYEAHKEPVPFGELNTLSQDEIKWAAQNKATAQRHEQTQSSTKASSWFSDKKVAQNSSN